MPLRPCVFITISTAGPTISAAAVPAARHKPPDNCCRRSAGSTRISTAAGVASSFSASHTSDGAIRKNPAIRHGSPSTKCAQNRIDFS